TRIKDARRDVTVGNCPLLVLEHAETRRIEEVVHCPDERSLPSGLERPRRSMLTQPARCVTTPPTALTANAYGWSRPKTPRRRARRARAAKTADASYRAPTTPIRPASCSPSSR